MEGGRTRTEHHSTTRDAAYSTPAQRQCEELNLGDSNPETCLKELENLDDLKKEEAQITKELKEFQGLPPDIAAAEKRGLCGENNHSIFCLYLLLPPFPSLFPSKRWGSFHEPITPTPNCLLAVKKLNNQYLGAKLPIVWLKGVPLDGTSLTLRCGVKKYGTVECRSRVKLISAVGQKAYKQTERSGRDNTTVMACVSAAGKSLPPLVIYKGANLWTTWKGDYDKPGSFYAASENGWMTIAIFQEWWRSRADITAALRAEEKLTAGRYRERANLIP
uniref:DDE-1 domain-containing protein n=1 Tax=Timema bartmani TaxID=61472 RepID=A0A7R9F5J8_9NEOP|nr:unnamed protein product [Timema bartmani]